MATYFKPRHLLLLLCLVFTPLGMTFLLPTSSEAVELNPEGKIHILDPSYKGIVSWYEMNQGDYSIEIKTQAVGKNGVIGGVNSVFFIPKAGNQFFTVSQFQASNNGRVLTYFLTDTNLLYATTTISLNIINLTERGELATEPSQIILAQGPSGEMHWPIVTNGNQLQVGASF